MKKHEFMTRLANALHSPSSVCSAPAPVRHQKELRRIRTTLQASNARLFAADIESQLLEKSVYHNRRRVP